MQALAQMEKNKVSRMIVVDQGHLEGIISLKDMLKFIALKVELESDSQQLSRLPSDDDV